MRIHRIAFVALLVLTSVALVLGTGCAQVAEKAAESAVERAVEGQTGVDIEKDGESVTITGENGEQITTSSDGELPDGFPDVVPVYEGKITGSMKAEQGYTVVIATRDDVSKVWDWYVANFKDGWSNNTEVKVEQGGMLSAEKSGWTVQVTVGEDSAEAGASIITIFAAKATQ